MASIESLLEGAHPASWDEALDAVTPHEPARLSAAEIRRCRACNQGRLAALLGRTARLLWQLSQVRVRVRVSWLGEP